MWDLLNTNYTFLRVDPGRRVQCKENEGGLSHASPSPRHRIFSPAVSPSGWSTPRRIPAPQTPNGISGWLASSSLPSHVGREPASVQPLRARVLLPLPVTCIFRVSSGKSSAKSASSSLRTWSLTRAAQELQGPRIAGPCPTS